MPDYLVTWEIELYAASPEEAVRQALEIICDDLSIAHVFKVYDASGNEYRVDLDEVNS